MIDRAQCIEACHLEERFTTDLVVLNSKLPARHRCGNLRNLCLGVSTRTSSACEHL